MPVVFDDTATDTAAIDEKHLAAVLEYNDSNPRKTKKEASRKVQIQKKSPEQLHMNSTPQLIPKEISRKGQVRRRAAVVNAEIEVKNDDELELESSQHASPLPQRRRSKRGRVEGTDLP